jgi:hypothetical protein
MTRTTNARLAGFMFLFRQRDQSPGSALLLPLPACPEYPVPLAWLGVLASILLVVGLSLQLADFLCGPATYFMWIPTAVFEVMLGLWLLIRGVAAPQRENRRGIATPFLA